MGTKRETKKLLSDEQVQTILDSENKLHNRGVGVLVALQVIFTVIISAIFISKGGTHVPYEIIAAAILSFIIIMGLFVAAFFLFPVYMPLIEAFLYIRELLTKSAK